jgi:hypothetical protein
MAAVGCHCCLLIIRRTIITFSFWQKTGLIKPFESVEEYESFINDCIKIPKLDIIANTPLKKSRVKKGINERGEKFDSKWEFIAATYYREIEGKAVERNRTQFVTYLDENRKMRKWFWDLNVGGERYEIKGIFRERDLLKQQQYPEIKFIIKEDIEKMVDKLNAKLGTEWKNNFTAL